MTRRIDIKAVLADSTQKKRMLDGMQQFLREIKDDVPHEIRSERPPAGHRGVCSYPASQDQGKP